MAEKTRKVVFGRINRRNDQQDTFEGRSFAEDMAVLADSRLVRHTEKSTAGKSGVTWTAADMELTAHGDYLTGVLGFAEQQQQVEFDSESWSWMKGDVRDTDAASDRSITPFAIDLRDGHRWIAFATTARLAPNRFRKGFEESINSAVSALGLMPTAWEVDLVTSAWRIDQWLDTHPRVFSLKRTLKFSNPGRDLDDDRAEMRALAANRKTEEFAAPRGQSLNVEAESFRGKLEGTETGDLDVIMKARGEYGARQVQFNSRKTVDDSRIDEFGNDLRRGIDIVLAALQEYVSSKDGPAQPRLQD